jgi:hypothetical protein
LTGSAPERSPCREMRSGAYLFVDTSATPGLKHGFWFGLLACCVSLGL